MTASSVELHSRVLVLNRSFMPIQVTTLKRAFCMVYVGIAKIVDAQYQTFDFNDWSQLKVAEGEASIGLIGKAIKVPKIILLQVYDKVPQKQVRFSRLNIYARDKNVCQYCGKTFARVDLNLDHVVPKSQGGGTHWENIVCSCINCNRKKGGRTPEQARMKLLRKPEKPNWTESLMLAMKNSFHKEWMPFFGIVDFSYWNVELEEES